MQIHITAPTRVHTAVSLPSSKSICNRALIIHALAHGTTPLHRLSDCDDTQAMVHALQSQEETVDIGAAGTAMRFLTAYYAIRQGETRILTGTPRMQQRPIRILADALRSLGADIRYIKSEGFPPLRITGRTLETSEVSLPGNVSSQYISALLMIGPMLPDGLTLHLTGELISRPYIDLTIGLMQEFGAQVAWQTGSDAPLIRVEPQPYRPHPFTVESDWSAASYWYEITALCDEATVRLPGLRADSLQGDSAVASLFEKLGVRTHYTDEGVLLEKCPRAISRMDYDFTDQPDLAQTFVVACALLDVPFRFCGLQSLKIKETDRIAALIAEMRKLGYVLQEESDHAALVWDGTRVTADSHPVIRTYDDHRMALAFAPASLRINLLHISDPHVVSKSYPHYWDDLSQAGFNCIQS